MCNISQFNGALSNIIYVYDIIVIYKITSSRRFYKNALKQVKTVDEIVNTVSNENTE